jgi:hypothetical protein
MGGEDLAMALGGRVERRETGQLRMRRQARLNLLDWGDVGDVWGVRYAGDVVDEAAHHGVGSGRLRCSGLLCGWMWLDLGLVP